jgi:aminopeptidase N
MALVAGAPVVAQAQTGEADSRACAGARGVGDPYYPNYGNGGYDVAHYDLDITYDPSTDVLQGHAGIRASATQRLCRFNLDLVGLEVRSLAVDGKPASWTRTAHELIVTPIHTIANGQRFEVDVRYDGVPVEFTLPGFGIRTGFMTTPDGVTVAGQPEVATAWFPVNDHPVDKASYSFEVTVPDPYEVVANGSLRGRDRAQGWTTFNWEAPEPMISYLATIDIGFWRVNRSRTDTGLPVYDAVDPAITGGLRREIDSSLARQGEVLTLLSDAFGPYPFSTVGAIVDAQDDLFFALETQTRPVYSKLFWTDPAGNPVNGDFVVVHELAHQWFGDDLALGRWQDIWLNEGFATYAEWLWLEHEGQADPQGVFEANFKAIPRNDPFWSVVIGDPTVERLFDFPVYLRGAMTLQALRNAVGDDAFWEIIRTWAASKSGGSVITKEFIALAEQVSGQQLDDLFDTWLFTPKKPPPSAVLPGAGAEQATVDTAAVAQASTAAAAWLDGFRRRVALGRH